MPRKSKAEEEAPAVGATITSSITTIVPATVIAHSGRSSAVATPPAEPELPTFGQFTVRKVEASSDSGFGFDVFDNVLGRRVDGPFRDEDAAVARARKRDIREG